jgi:hypothetical protein
MFDENVERLRTITEMATHAIQNQDMLHSSRCLLKNIASIAESVSPELDECEGMSVYISVTALDNNTALFSFVVVENDKLVTRWTRSLPIKQRNEHKLTLIAVVDALKTIAATLNKSRRYVQVVMYDKQAFLTIDSNIYSETDETSDVILNIRTHMQLIASTVIFRWMPRIGSPHFLLEK